MVEKNEYGFGTECCSLPRSSYCLQERTAENKGLAGYSIQDTERNIRENRLYPEFMLSENKSHKSLLPVINEELGSIRLMNRIYAAGVEVAKEEQIENENRNHDWAPRRIP